MRAGRSGFARKAASVLCALALVVGMCPASGFADEPYGTGTGQSGASMGGQGTTASTDVKVAVTSTFEVWVDNEEPVVIEDARKLASGAYTLRGTLGHGNPLRDSAGMYYEYKWTREVWVAGEGAQAGAWADDAAYNEAHDAWLRADIEDATGAVVELAPFDLYEVRDMLDFAGQARYRYSLVAKDSALERTSANNVEVVCTAHYADAEVSTPALDDAIYVRGLLHVGDPQLHASTLTSSSAAYGLLLQAAEGLALDSAFDLAITEQQAANHGEPAYLEPLAYIQIPLSSAVPADAEVRAFAITAAGGAPGMASELIEAQVVEVDGVRYVQIASGATLADAASPLVCGAFAVAYAPASDKPAVRVVSQVAGEGGLIDIMGAHTFAQGTTVRYTFLPAPGYCLERVEVVEGNPERPSSQHIYYAGDPCDCFGANWLDYLVAPSNTAHPADVIITAHFAKAAIEDPAALYTVTAATGSGEGSVQIVGGSSIPGATGVQLISVKAGSAVSIQMTPAEGCVLDHVEVTTGEGSAAVVERPQVLGGVLTLPAVTANTSVVAHFKEGTPVTYPDASITYAPAENGTLGEGSPVSAAYGSAVAVQVVPDAGYRTVSAWFVFDDDASETHHPLRYTGSGTSWIIDHVLGDITVHAVFASATGQARIVSGEGGSVSASYTDAQGDAVSGIDASAPGATIADIAVDSDLQLTVAPETGKLVEVVVVRTDGASEPVTASANGVYVIPNATLISEAFDHIEVTFRDIASDMLSVGLEMPDAGVKVYRTDVAGAGEIAPGTTRLEGIDPNTGLSLRVELTEGYEKLAVEVLDAEGNVIHAATIGADGAVQIASEFISAANTVRITCEPTSVVPPEHDDIEVIATTDGNGAITTTDKTSFTADEELTNITYTITADEGYALDYIAISGSDGSVEVRTFAGTPVSDGTWSFTLPAALIAAGYDRVHASFKQLPEPGASYWVTPIVVDEAGAPVSGEAAHGTVSPDAPFEVAAGGVATLNFVPDAKYRAEVSLIGANGPWSQVDRLSYTIGMDGGITKDTDVYIRFIADPSAEERETHTVEASVFGGAGGRISPEGSVTVAHRGSAAFSFFPDDGYALSYVVVDAGSSDELVVLPEQLPASGQYVLSNITADHTVTAVFAEEGALDDVVVWQVSAGEHGEASPSGRVLALISQGGRTIQIVPDDGYVIDKVTINGSEVALIQDSAFTGTSFGGAYRLPALPGGGGTFHVTFTERPSQVALHVKVNGTGGTASPLGDSVVRAGAQQTVTFVPDEGYKLAYARFTDAKGDALTNGDFTAQAIAGSYTHTFTMSSERWVECAFERLGEGEEPPVEPADAIWISAVSVGTGIISPYGELALYPSIASSKITFSLIPDAGARLVALTVGGRDVTSEVQGGSYTLLASDAHDGDEVRAVFEKSAPVLGAVELTAGSGGRISPEGTVHPEVGSTLPVSFIPAEGMQVESVQLIYADADGGLRTKTITGSMTHYNVAVSADLVEVHVTFKEADGSAPAVKKATVRTTLASGSEALGSIFPEADTVVEVVAGGTALFTFQPKPGYRVASAKLNGGANLVQVGATQLYLGYAQLLRAGADKETSVLEVAFEEIPANPDYVNIYVDVSTSTSGGARSGIEAGAGGMVSPSNIRVPYGSSDAYGFFVFPDEGYRIDSITASVDGGASVALDYSTKDHVGAVNDIAAIVTGASAASADTLADDLMGQGDARYYAFQLKNITGNVDVQVEFAPIADGEEDDAINGDGSRVELTVEASEGGFVSPAGTMTLPEGCTYPFLIEPDSAAWEPVAVVITYADGTKKIIEEVSAGRLPLVIEAGMEHVYVAFEEVGQLTEMVRITAEASGPGSISPAGTFQAKKGSNQAFTFRFDTAYTYIKSLVVERADGTTQDLAADGWVWKFDTAYYEYDVSGDMSVRVEFAEGDERNPMWEQTRYTRIEALATTEGQVSSAGGTIEPAGTVEVEAGVGAQLFCFQPNRGYVVSSVSVIEGSGPDAKVRMLSADELAAREVLVSGIEDDVQVIADFIAAYYLVDVSSGEGGSFDVEGMGIQVRQGQRLALYAQPDDGYELADITTSGLVVHDEAAVSEDDGQVRRMATLGGRAAPSSELHTFAVAGPGSVHGSFKAKSEGPSDPDDPNNPSGPGNAGSDDGNSAAAQVHVKVSSSGNGEVDPAGDLVLAKGSTLTLTLKPAVGYYPASVTLKTAQGERTIANAARTFTMEVQEDCELIANFSAVAAPGSSSPALRAIRTLQSLAKTGDNAAIAIVALMGIACAGMGLMLVSRRRKEREAED